jgi:phage tail P2-like protein
MADHLLPPNATKFEIALSETLERITDIPVPVDTLWDPERCPASHLPWLAWALSVDVWDPAWPEAVKRRMLAASPEIHRLKGTRGAVERALAALGAVTEITEWFETTPKGTPGTFDVIAYANEHITSGSVLLTAELQEQMLRAVMRSKPVCRSFSFKLGAGFKAEAGFGNAARAFGKIDPTGEAMVPGLGSQATLGAAARAISHIELAADTILPGLGSMAAIAMAGRSHSFMQLEGELVE